MHCSEIDLQQLQNVRFVVVEEVRLVTCFGITNFVTSVKNTSMENILYNHTPELLDGPPSEYRHQKYVADRVVADMKKKGIHRSGAEELYLCMSLCENDVRPGTTCIRFSSGSSRPQYLQQLHKRKSQDRHQRAVTGRMVANMDKKGMDRSAEP